jgi:integrative and conjugative element protein (TIGR02256 family)
MNKNDLAFYNDYFSKLEKFEIKKFFRYNKDENRFEGEISYNSLTFQVHIPEVYPLGDIKFITKDFEGLPHQNFDGSLCLNTNFVNHTFTRLNLEIQKLKSYVRDYYEKGVEDEHYEYSAFDAKGVVTLIFQEDKFNLSRFDKPFGRFKYSVLSFHRNDKNKITQLTALAQNLGNTEYSWSSSYHKKDKYIGAWVFLEKEPVHSKKNRFKNWGDLSKILPPDFSDFFRNFCKSSANYRLYPNGLEPYIFLAIGYKIPNLDGFEVHWDLILIPRYDFSRKGLQTIDRYSREIIWDNTYNASYGRYFGRGALNKNLASRKTLVIGNGAIGSSLSEILARAGLRRIDLADIDIVEPGNICRSSYDFTEVSFSKSAQLKQKLENISPFVEVNIFSELKATSPKSEKYQEVFDKLNSYDLIIDCTANNEIIQMLTDMRLSNLVCYISMSNKAREMIFVTNSDNSNIIERRNQMLYSFGTFTEPEFREGTGCWHPTFEASNFDINQLLNFTVRKINSFFVENIQPRSFYSFIDNDYISLSEDVKFYQSELNLTLTVESSVLETIEQYSRAHYPNEFGGILMGSYLNSYIDLVISDIIVPDKYKSSPTKFEPDHKDLNIKTKEYFQHFDNKVIYVGDWHSHPNGSNHFSQPDFNSIKDVAKSKTVNIKNPILLIAAYSYNYFDPGFYVYNKDKLYKFERQ